MAMRRFAPLALCAACACAASSPPPPAAFVFVPTAEPAPPAAAHRDQSASLSPVELPAHAATVPLATAVRDAILADSARAAGVDADRLRRGRELELSGDLGGARRAYLELIVTTPQSPLVPYAYLAFGDLFFDEAEHDDPTKLPPAQQAYQKVVSYPPPGNLAYAFAWHRLGIVASRLGDDAHALDAQRKALIALGQYPTLPVGPALAEASRGELVVAYARAGQPDRALTFFRATAPQDASGLLIALGREYVRRGMVRGAGRPLRRLARGPRRRALRRRRRGDARAPRPRRRAVHGPPRPPPDEDAGHVRPVTVPPGVAMCSGAACLFVAAVAACSRSSAPASRGDVGGGAYARASASLDAEHPATLPEVARVLGRRPESCDLGDATCVCTWRFLTKEGMKEIGAAASFADARTFEPETVLMVGRDGSPLDLPPDEAERGYRAGEYRAPVSGRVPVATAGGRVDTVGPEDLSALLNGGGHLVSRRALKAAELEKGYESWTAARRLDACLAQPAQVRLVKRDGVTVPW